MAHKNFSTPSPACVLGLALLGVAFSPMGAAQQAVQVGASSAQAGEPNPDDTGGEQGGRPNWVFTPRISVSETLTDNAVLGQAGQRDDQITQISPGLRLEGRSARLKAYFDYSLNQLYYAQNASKNRTVNTLNSFGTLETLENWLFLDFSANISQQNLSAFGTQSSGIESINSNTTETSTYALSPYIRGRLFGAADYLLRYYRSTTRMQSDLVSGNDAETWTAHLGGDVGLANLSWALDASQFSAKYQNGGWRNEADRYAGTLTWRLIPQFRINLSAGSETNNYLNPNKETHATHGYGFDWSPTPRTQLSAFRERRFFGNGHRISFTHRTPLTAWRLLDARDVEVMGQSGTTGVGSFYDIIYSLSATAPGIDANDALARAAWTNTYFLLNPGLSPTTLVPSGFLSSQARLQRQQEFSFAITGVRNTLTFMATQNRREALYSQTLLLFDNTFQQSSVIKQRGFSINWAHRLTPDSNLSLVATHADNTGTAEPRLRTTQKSLILNVSTRIGPKTTASLGVRHAEFDGTHPYTENALTGTLNARF